MHRIDSCVYDVYLRVLERVRWLLAHGGPRELAAVTANLDALVGGARVAAGLARVDAESERATRPTSDLCRCACDRLECPSHPRAR